MIKRILPVVLGIALISLNACNNNGMKKTKDGLEYRIIKDEKGGQSPKEGDIVSIHIKVHVGDSVLMDSRKMNNNTPIDIPLMPALSSFKGDWPEGLKLLTPGDSALFLVPVDSLRKLNQGQLPKWMKSGDKISYEVVLVSVKSQDEVNKEHQQKTAQQKEIDDKILQDYFTQNNLKPNKTSSGLYYIIEKEGSGPLPSPGQTVVVNYTGKTLDGKTFDSNVDPQFQHVQPFKYVAGRGEVIPGWDEGVMLLKKGSKAKLFLPSPLAYGPQSPGPGVSANAILMFEVEVTDIINSAAAPVAQ
jgi:FKBP-type peptidyl-prolyl cis-trans isomerase FkpA